VRSSTVEGFFDPPQGALRKKSTPSRNLGSISEILNGVAWPEKLAEGAPRNQAPNTFWLIKPTTNPKSRLSGKTAPLINNFLNFF